jgi:tRNA(Ile)-lysidine synthase
VFNELISFFRSLSGNGGGVSCSVLAGVSGGADSVALIHLLHEYRQQLSIDRLAVAHVNHGLRGDESDGDEEFVRAISERLQVEFFRVGLQQRVSGITGDDNTFPGLEDWARRERYRFFHETVRANNFNYIATAHTANDQAETLLLRVTRGAGIRGLRGILPLRGDGVIRPLLNIERGELEQWLTARNLPFRTDSTNADDTFRRNFIRNRIIPQLREVNPAAIRNMAACAESAARAWGIVEGLVNRWAAMYLLRVNDEAFHVEKAGLADKSIAPEALLMLFEEYGISPSKLHIDRVMGSISVSSGEYLLPDGWKFYPREDRVCFVRSQGNNAAGRR